MQRDAVYEIASETHSVCDTPKGVSQ
eukprot:COSAG01_NODE_46937_length_395_cov_0.942568_1_plen_25_part_10